MAKIYDASVVTGTYTNKQGEQKNRYINIGSVMEGKDGGMFLLLDRTFNPAGCPNEENRSNVLISFFVPKEDFKTGESVNAPAKTIKTNEDKSQSSSGGFDEFEDSIPF